MNSSLNKVVAQMKQTVDDESNAVRFFIAGHHRQGVFTQCPKDNMNMIMMKTLNNSQSRNSKTYMFASHL